VVVRETTSGLYFGQPKRQFDDDGVEAAVDTMIYRRPEVERIARKWRPFRSWAEVLLVLRLHREGGRHAVVSRPRGRRRTVDP